MIVRAGGQVFDFSNMTRGNLTRIIAAANYAYDNNTHGQKTVKTQKDRRAKKAAEQKAKLMAGLKKITKRKARQLDPELAAELDDEYGQTYSGPYYYDEKNDIVYVADGDTLFHYEWQSRGMVGIDYNLDY